MHNMTGVQETESRIGTGDSAGSEKRRKWGRPRKVQPAAGIDPAVLHRAVLEVKMIAREYARGDLQSDVRSIRTTRPRLLKNAGIFDGDGQDGSVRYDVQSVSAMTEEDKKVIYRYISSVEKIVFLEKAARGIPETGIREVAYDTLLKGIRVADFAEQYDLPERTVRWRKHRALEYMAELYLMTLSAQFSIF